MTTHGRVYRECSPVVDSRFDVDAEGSLSAALVEALAEAEQVPESDIPSLYDSIDLDAVTYLLEAVIYLLESVIYRLESVDSDAILAFSIKRWMVFIRADGRIRVCDSTRPTDPTPVFTGPAGRE